MQTFPRISRNTKIPIENLSEGESYYMKTNGSCSSLFHGRILELNDRFVRVENKRAISGDSRISGTYIKLEHEFGTFQMSSEMVHQGLNVCFAISPVADEIAIGMVANVVVVWKLITGDHVANLGNICKDNGDEPCNYEIHEHIMSCIDYSPNGKYLVAGSTCGYMYVWDNFNKELLHKVLTIANFVSDISFNADSDTIIMHSVMNRSVHMWSISKQNFVGSLAINKYTPTQLRNDPCDPMKNLFSDNVFVNAVSFSPGGENIAMLSTINVNRSALAIWRHVNNKFLLLNICDLEGHYSSIKYNSSGLQLMLCNENGTISILNEHDLSLDAVISKNLGIHCANYSPSGDYIVMCGSLTHISVINAHTKEDVSNFTYDLIKTYTGDYIEDYDGVVTARFSDDETKLIVCYPFYVREIPWQPPIFIPDEFKTQLIAEGLSGGLDLPDRAKLLICEYLHGVAVLY
jgi:hypothetical protein